MTNSINLISLIWWCNEDQMLNNFPGVILFTPRWRHIYPVFIHSDDEDHQRPPLVAAAFFKLKICRSMGGDSAIHVCVLLVNAL